MALKDILTAITQEADRKITEARAAHQKEVTTLREESERAMAKKKQDVSVQKEQRREQLKAKTANHAALHKRNVILQKKQELLERTYAEVTEKLSSLPDDKIEPLLKACLEQITAEGKVHPAGKHEKILTKLTSGTQFEMGSPISAAGGFRFITEKQEEDCTLEHLVEHVLHPETELSTSQALFGSA